ncbi:magnesium-protoporphyrin IX monomethyl ester (oxidative) cyclase [Candidatus Cyanaurora vandensis]|uniref:magnesium-protoporphyrin IX monomethyl ester (oxidative) cyclase n=1 Tax=Candidatus Cyanaurora vandensis TaxID=2714958 RepID=UPI0025807BDD|nr:magnesium-protoporphyrin IX monomethyl ester (oxidative) cyclase [Candidatus Cyanaurora vandensis]
MVDTIDTATRYKAPVKETLLTPRFYTTDFDELAKLDISAVATDLEALMQEFRVDYNRHHFERDGVYTLEAKDLMGPVRDIFVHFLERSCTSEFSGFVLYKEIARRLKTVNPLLAEGFHFMSRDEARHAGFLNKTMADFGLALNLPALKKNKKYTFFKPKFIFYATYLSEKIGYFRYITIFRHLEQHPEHRFHPLFTYFENWCQDENRHGDFFDLILRSQPRLLRGLNRLWVKFFLTAVFVTMYLNDHKDRGIYDALGLDPTVYAKEVLVRTNREAGKAFPVILDMDDQFWARMERCLASTLKLGTLNNLPTKLPHYLSIAWNYFQIWAAKPIETSVRTVL